MVIRIDGAWVWVSIPELYPQGTDYISFYNHQPIVQILIRVIDLIGWGMDYLCKPKQKEHSSVTKVIVNGLLKN